ncbi:IucA/IucC family protein [Yersinia aldovae]|uniref:IucA/IucC family protein n=1 Tax=Yersinia aldovae TaxID=29483 RepID=UPI0011A3C21B|nr:IucA/IucC family siderophore biosynthesis protein [Yersinia aldovae]
MASMRKFNDNYIQHLNGENWSRANTHLVGKILRELSHEKLIAPTRLETQANGLFRYSFCPDSVSSNHNKIEYRFSAYPYQLDHLDIEADTLIKTVEGKQQPLDALQLIIELNSLLCISEKMLPLYLDEISSTLYGHAFKYHHNNLSSTQLTQADYQSVETAMSEGHPVFIANNGRIGFDIADYAHFAPESAHSIKLIWIAVHKNKTVFASLTGLSYQQLMQEELGNYQTEDFLRQLTSRGLNANDYFFMPLHPWQWYERIATSFAADIARNDIVYLGQGQDSYLAQQSIRTFFNISNPQKNYVKTALSILNMGFMRGLSPHSMATTPRVNEWLATLVSQDPFFQQKKFTILRERAAMGYFNDYFETALIKDNPHKKMLSALWRESPIPLLANHQRLMTMASLLHRDNTGNSVVAALVHSSGLATDKWIAQYLDAYLSPLLHAFFTYDLVFMPHGENLMLVLENNVPVHVLMKDIGEEIAILNGDIILPEEIKDLHVTVEDDMKINYIFLDIFDCFFRYLTPILQKDLGLPEHQFWKLIADCIYAYQAQYPALADKYNQFDLFKADFVRTCLNRLQMANNQQMIDLDDREKNLKFAGTLANPIHAFKTAG